MKAVVSERYGSPDVLEIRQVPRPEPAYGEVLVKVHATTVNRTDSANLKAHPFFVRLMIGLFRPKHTILGMDFAGTVAAVGSGVVAFKLGDRVFGMSPERFGGHAEFISVPEKGEIALAPGKLAFDEAVVCEGAWYADSTVGRLKTGQLILIYGASGAIGTAAVQLAKTHGAEVTAVVATEHLELAKGLGADRVIDYTAEDFSRIGETFDIVFDAVGKTSFFRCRRLLKPTGIFAATDLGPWWSNIFLGLWFSMTGSRRVTIPFPKNGRALVQNLSALMDTGKFRGVFDRSYRLDKIVDAYRYVETGQKTGIVVIDVYPDA
jgi:NADPH:quinone reductase-like Zn-dependent oxidoreductase